MLMRWGVHYTVLYSKSKKDHSNYIVRVLAVISRDILTNGHCYLLIILVLYLYCLPDRPL